MHIRETFTRRNKNGEPVKSFRLMESIRIGNKVFSNVVLNLGANYSFPRDKWAYLTSRLDQLLNGEHPKELFPLFETIDQDVEIEAHRLMKLIFRKRGKTMEVSRKLEGISHQETRETLKKEEKTNDVINGEINGEINNNTLKTIDNNLSSAHFEEININEINAEDCRSAGGEYLALSSIHRMGLPKVLEDAGLNHKQIRLAVASVIGRMIHPGSDLSTIAWLEKNSALDELMGTDFSSIDINAFYRTADALWENRKKIESLMYEKSRVLFEREPKLIIYDLTNTYFEGTGKFNPKAKLGRSKEKRSDCPLVTLGLLIDEFGFIRKSEIFDGNISEPTTLKEILDRMEISNAILIFDAGIMTEENLKTAKEKGYQYIAMSRVSPKEFDESQATEIREKDGNKVEGYMKSDGDGKIQLVCRSEAMAKAEKPYLNGRRKKLEEELKDLKDGLSKPRHMKSYSKVLEKIGRIKERYAKVAKHLNIAITADTKQKYAIDIKWEEKESYNSDLLNGVYQLCAHVKDATMGAQMLWETYMTLTRIESVFQQLKSELGLRPVYHQKEIRVSAHLFISVLAYHVIHSIRYQLARQNIHLSWESIRTIFSTQTRITFRAPNRKGKLVRVRTGTLPTPKQKIIYKALSIHPIPGKKIISVG